MDKQALRNVQQAVHAAMLTAIKNLPVTGKENADTFTAIWAEYMNLDMIYCRLSEKILVAITESDGGE